MPPPDTSGSAGRFSSTVTFQPGPHSAEALDGALRLANPFSYTNEASHVLFNSPFLRLPDLSVLRPPRIESYETPSPLEPAVQDWLNNRAPRLIPSRHRTFTPVPLGLVDYFNSNIHLPQVSMLIASHQCHNEDAAAEARRHKRNFSPTAFLRIIPADTVMSGNRPPDIPSTSPTPEPRPISFHHPSQTSKHPQGQHNLPTRRRLRPLVHNTLLLQVLALTPNDPAYPVKAALPQIDPLDCPSFLTAPDPWDPPPFQLIVPAVGLVIKVKVLTKVHLKAKTNFPPIGHLSTLVPLKALPRTLLGPPLEAPPRVPIKASLLAKVSTHLPYTHLLPTPHLMVIHKTSLQTHLTPISLPSLPLLPVWAYCPAGSQDPLPPSIPGLVIPLTRIPPFTTRRCHPFSSFLLTLFPLHPGSLLLVMISRLLFMLTLLISIFFLPLSSYLPSSLRGQPGHIVRLVALTPVAPGSPSPSRYRSFFPIYFLSLLQPSPSASPLLCLCCLSRCLPKVAWPNVAAPFVDITQSGCLPPCQTPLAVRRLSSSAITARCYYEPPTILVPPMLVEAVDHFARYCLLALSSLLQVWFSPSQARYSSLWCLFVVFLFH